MDKKKNYILLENIRSCYNVGNIIRTADALWRDVVLTGYTPSPFTQPKVKKTSLWAEEHVGILEFLTTKAAIEYFRENAYDIVAAEVNDQAVSLDVYTKWLAAYTKNYKNTKNRVVIVGNEVLWVEFDTLQLVDTVLKIPMSGVKESLNVWQTAAIFMRALRNDSN